MESRRLKLVDLIIVLCLVVFSFSTYSTAQEKDGLLKINFFDIGQGDAIWIETPSGHQILVDGGPGRTVLGRLGEVMPFFDKDIDVVLMTHPDADHASGLVGVLERYDVKNIIYSDIVTDKSLYQEWEVLIEGEGAIAIDPYSGKKIDFGDGVYLEFVYPLESIAGQIVKEGETNNNSVVAILRYKDFELLLTGDLEFKGERRLLMAGIDIDADVLKVGHHGSRGSTGEEFLSAVSPDVAIIQVGSKNRYGHPTAEVLERLENYGIKVYRNDLEGNIKLVSDGNFFQILNSK